MRSPRRRAREFALQGLYQWQLSGRERRRDRAQPRRARGLRRGRRAPSSTAELAGVIGEAEGLQALLEPLADRKWAEVSPVEKAILLIGAWEIAHVPEMPYRVAINEAIELAKRFGGTDGHKYVNGILDRVAAAVRPEEVAAGRTAERKPRQASTGRTRPPPKKGRSMIENPPNSTSSRATSRGPPRNAVLGVGDDCALVDVSNGMDLAVSTDTMVSGTHFFPDVDPETLGHKALAVNLSDMAAMGAMPYWAMLALTVPAREPRVARQVRQGLLRPGGGIRRLAHRRRHDEGPAHA